MPRTSGISREPVELRPDVVGHQVGIGDDARAASRCAPPPTAPIPPRPAPARRPVGLDVDGLDHARACDVGEVLLDRVVAPDRLVGTEDARHHRPHEPRQVGLPPDMMMRVDDGLGHGRYIPVRVWIRAHFRPPSARPCASRDPASFWHNRACHGLDPRLRACEGIGMPSVGHQDANPPTSAHPCASRDPAFTTRP